MSSVEQAAARVAAADTVLILRPQSMAHTDAEWKRALVDDVESVELLGVSLSEQPGGWYEKWRAALGTEPKSAAVITIPELVEDDVPADIDVKTVATPSNLTGIGVKATPYLSQWRDAVVAVEPLTVLFQYTDAENAYRFLHVLTTRLRTTGGSAQVYVDPTVVDERMVELLKTLFEGCVVYDGDDADDRWQTHVQQFQGGASGLKERPKRSEVSE